MKIPKYTNLLVVATMIASKTSFVQGDEPSPESVQPILISNPVDEPEYIDEVGEHEPPIPKTIPPITLTPITRPPPDPISKTVLCSNERKELMSTLIDCLRFPIEVPTKRVRGCNRRFTRSWKLLSKNRPKNPAVCPVKPPADAITDLVPICGKASLDSKECQILAETLLKLSVIEKEEETITCTDDGKICPGGKVVYRDPDNNCEFSECPEPKICTQDVQQCPDGSYVGRDSFNDCAFKPCPQEKAACPEGAKQCADGSFLDPDPENNCDFPKCPEEIIMCTQDVKECEDGSYVGRDPDNNCEFKPCP